MWNLAIAGIPEEEWGRYLPREKLRWKKVPIQDDRSGPLPSVKCAPNLAAAVRAAETFHEVTTRALGSRSSIKWRNALAQLLESKHCSIIALETTIGMEAMTTLLEDAAKLLQWMVGRAMEPPRLLLNRIEAARKKSIKVLKDSREDKWKE